MAKILTDLAIRNIKPKASRLEVPDGGCRGLYLIVQSTGAKSWAVRYRINGRPAKFTLGPVLAADRNTQEAAEPKIGGLLTLAGARKLAADALHHVRQGKDPGRAKQTAKADAARIAADTFEAVSEEYLKRAKARGGGELRTKAWRHAVLKRMIYPVIGARAIADLRRREINDLLDTIEDVRGPVMADRALAIVRRICNWHATRDDDFVSPIVPGMARTSGKERARSRVLDDHELAAVWKAADSAGPFGAMVRFILLTGARRTEAAAMTWSELVGGDWRLPAARNKTKVALVRPLSGAAWSLLTKLPRIEGVDFVFSAGARPFNNFSHAKAEFDKACGVTGWTLHDLRRTSRTLLARAEVPSAHAEQCLGHVIRGVEGTYNRHSYRGEMHRAYEALAAEIERIVSPPASNVAPFRKRRQVGVS